MQPYCHYSAIFDIMCQSSGMHLYLKCLFSPTNLGSKRRSVKENVRTLFPAQKIHTGKTMNFSFFSLTFKNNQNNFLWALCLVWMMFFSFSVSDCWSMGFHGSHHQYVLNETVCLN